MVTRKNSAKNARSDATESKTRIFTNIEALDETDNIADKDFIAEEQNAEKHLNEIVGAYISKNQSRIIAYQGPFGSGKSVVLNSLAEKDNKNYNLVKFDIWQYSDPTLMWQGFITEVLSKIENKTRRDVTNDIDGMDRLYDILKTKRRMMFAIGAILIAYSLFSLALWYLFRNCPFVKPFLEYAVAPFFSILVILGIVSVWPRRGKLTRIFQYEDKLFSGLQTINKPIVAIIEDVDRSDNGYIFLESLHVFMQKAKENNKLKKSLLIICPQDSTSFGKVIGGNNDIVKDNTEKLSRSIKIYDDVINTFLPSGVSEESIQKLLSSLGCADKRFSDILSKLLKLENSSQISLRLLKFALREVYDFQSVYPECNAYLALMYCLTRYTHANINRPAEPSAMQTILRGKSRISLPPRNTLIAPDDKNILNTLELMLPSLKGGDRINVRNLDGVVVVEYDDMQDESCVKVVQSPREPNQGGTLSPWFENQLRITIDNKYRQLLHE